MDIHVNINVCIFFLYHTQSGRYAHTHCLYTDMRNKTNRPICSKMSCSVIAWSSWTSLNLLARSTDNDWYLLLVFFSWNSTNSADLPKHTINLLSQWIDFIVLKIIILTEMFSVFFITSLLACTHTRTHTNTNAQKSMHILLKYT